LSQGGSNYIQELEKLLDEEKNIISNLKNSKMHKMAYLLTRFCHEFVKGNARQKKMFFEWITDRKHRAAISEYHHVLKAEAALQRQEELLRGLKARYIDGTWEDPYQAMEKIISQYAGEYIVFFPELVDWNIPLFQRPQQMAMAFSKQNTMFLFATMNKQDQLYCATRIEDNCYVITQEHFEHAIRIARKYGKKTVLTIYSTDYIHARSEIQNWMKSMDILLYEYIDEFSDKISGSVTEEMMLRHREMLANPEVFVVATADKLYDEVVRVRGSTTRTLNSSNGVDCEHFMVETNIDHVPAALQPIIKRNKPIIGYFGAIAEWFDFELIAYAAKQRPEYEFMMIGPRYGEHNLSVLDELKKIENLHFVGTVDYKILPYVANYFSVATIPFKINEITESTSPIKLFEYMAMGKPCVTTAMRECFKYPVVKVAKTQKEYVEHLDWAVAKCNDEQYIEQLKCTADQNSWKQKAREILKLIEE